MSSTLIRDVNGGIDRFAKLMKSKLFMRSDKPGWDNLNLLWLYAKLGEEMGELGEALKNAANPTTGRIYLDADLEAMKGECVDVGNIAMMIADVISKR